MKIITGLPLMLIITAFALNLAVSQDSLSVQNLSLISHKFNVENGTISGTGAEFIFEKLSKAQFTLLGEYHYSKNISEFTEALIPQINKWGYRHLVLEVGPQTGAVLNRLPEDKKAVVTSLKRINQIYNCDEDNNPIPFFSKVEDAQFLGAAKKLGWNILGIDQEYLDGYNLLFDKMYENLNPKMKIEFHDKYKAAQDTLLRMQNEYKTKNVPSYSAIIKSTFIQGFLDQMTSEPINTQIVEAIRKSTQIYHFNDLGRWYDSNSTRIKYMKERLRLGLEVSNFDIAKDKLLIKMGGYHMSMGFSPLGFYEVGNMLNELAQYHGNSAVNIGFMNRYEMEENVLVDALDDDSNYIRSHSAFYGMGDKKEWVVIDLVKLREGFYYHPQKYLLNEYEEQIIQRFNLLILTPTEYPATNNF